MVIRRRLGPGFSFTYVPWGPELPHGFPPDDAARNQALVSLASALQNLLPKDTAFIRFDPPWYTEGDTPPPIYKPFSRAGADVQPPDTILIDLKSEEEAILSSMKSKGRYNIRLASKKGVTVRKADSDELPTFYTMLKETAKRDGIAIHGITYYQTLFSHCRDYPQGGQELGLYLAEHEGDVLAGVIVLFRGKDAVYLYGASSNHKRNYMAPYLLQWKVMRDARAKGCSVYDLFGVPPSADPNHPMAGLYRFKTGFGGRLIHRAGSWDYTYRPFIKTLFIAAEWIRKSIRSARRRKSEVSGQQAGKYSRSV